MKLRNYLNEKSDAESYRKIVLDWFNSVPHNKKNTKKMKEILL